MDDNPFAPALLIESRGAVRIVTINRPDAMNAVDEQVHRGLANVWRHLAADRQARAVVITGAGRAFFGRRRHGHVPKHPTRFRRAALSH